MPTDPTEPTDPTDPYDDGKEYLPGERNRSDDYAGPTLRWHELGNAVVCTYARMYPGDGVCWRLSRLSPDVADTACLIFDGAAGHAEIRRYALLYYDRKEAEWVVEDIDIRLGRPDCMVVRRAGNAVYAGVQAVGFLAQIRVLPAEMQRSLAGRHPPSAPHVAPATPAATPAVSEPPAAAAAATPERRQTAISDTPLSRAAAYLAGRTGGPPTCPCGKTMDAVAAHYESVPPGVQAAADRSPGSMALGCPTRHRTGVMPSGHAYAVAKLVNDDILHAIHQAAPGAGVLRACTPTLAGAWTAPSVVHAFTSSGLPLCVVSSRAAKPPQDASS